MAEGVATTGGGGGGGKGGKGKKNKGTKLDINTLVDPNSFKMVDSWADEMENEEIRVPMVNLPTAPKATTGADIDFDQIPNQPPFKAYVSNISFESNQANLEKFFSQFPNVKVTMGGEAGRPSGNCYVEFESKADLIEALHMNGKMLNNRNLKIQLSTTGDRGGGFGSGGRRPYHDNTPSNWRSREGLPPGPKGLVAPPPNEPDFGSRGGGGGRDFGSGFGGGRNNYGRDGDRGFGRRDGDRDDGGFRRRDDGGGFGSGFGGRSNYGGGRDGDRGFGRRDGDRDGDFRRRDDAPRREEGGSGGWRDAPRREDAGPRPDNGASSGGGWRTDGPRRGDDDGGFAPPRRDRYTGNDAANDQMPAASAPAPKPQAAPPAADKIDMKDVFSAITKVEEEAAKPNSYSSIFGGAKAVDTLSKELEIERKLAEVQKAKEAEAEEKKKAAAAAAGTDSSDKAPEGATADKAGNVSDTASVSSEQTGSRPAHDSRPKYQGDGQPSRYSGPRDFNHRDQRNGDRPYQARGRYEDRGQGGPRRYDSDRPNGDRPMYSRGDRRDDRGPRGPPRDGQGGYRDRRDGQSGGYQGNRYGGGGGRRDGPSDRYYQKRDGDGPMRRPANEFHAGGGGNDDGDIFDKKSSNNNYVMNNKFSQLEDHE